MLGGGDLALETTLRMGLNQNARGLGPRRS